MMSAKEQAQLALDKLDDKATWDEVFEELEVMVALEKSIRDVEEGQVIPHEEVMKIFDRCRANSK